MNPDDAQPDSDSIGPAGPQPPEIYADSTRQVSVDPEPMVAFEQPFLDQIIEADLSDGHVI
jgi:hypothetical protein